VIQVQLKMRMTKSQERECERWLYHLTSVYNWAVRKIELNAKDKIYFGRRQFGNLLGGHYEKLGIPSHVLRGTLDTAYLAWQRCFRKQASKPRLKGLRNKLSSIPFDAHISVRGNRVSLTYLGPVRFHKQEITAGPIKQGRLCRRSSGWYLCLFVDAKPRSIPRKAAGSIGIDPGFKHLLTLSTGEIIDHPREFEAAALRLAQAQRGCNRRLTARLHERIQNQRKDRNHKLSRRIVSENTLIAWSKDNHRAIASRFGKSVASSGHGQLRQFLSYKSAYSGTRFVEAGNRFSTMTCSNCGAQSGPTGLAGLKVRQWRCPCGAEHDRDVNAARNTLLAAAGLAVERSALTIRNSID
jgi:putative transposase